MDLFSHCSRLEVPRIETPRFVIADFCALPDSAFQQFFVADDFAWATYMQMPDGTIPKGFSETHAALFKDMVKPGPWKLICKKQPDGAEIPVGMFSLSRHEGDRVRVSPFVLPSARRQGVMGEAYGALLSTLYEHCGIRHMYVEVKQNNDAMHRVMEKFGARSLDAGPQVVAPPDAEPEIVDKFEIDLPLPPWLGKNHVAAIQQKRGETNPHHSDSEAFAERIRGGQVRILRGFFG